MTHGDNPYEFPVPPDAMKRGLPHEPDPHSAQYAPLVAAAKAVAHQHHHIILLCAADFDYREIAENWFKSIKRFSSNGLVYALDAAAHGYFASRGVTSFDGSANLEAWNSTRLQRHIQRAEAEKHIAAAAVAAAGLDVLLMDSTHVVTGDLMPALAALGKSSGDTAVDAAVPRAGCNGKPPVGCGLLWNLVYLHGSGTSEERSRAVTWQAASVRKGMVDFYLRWWNGAHCIFSGFGKHYDSCGPRLEGGLTPRDLIPNRTAADGGGSSSVRALGAVNSGLPIVKLGGCEGLRLGLLPEHLYAAGPMYGPSGVRSSSGLPPSLVARSPKPVQRDRLRLDRYDKQDFDELVAAMKADGLWLLT